MRLIVRRAKPTPGSQLALFANYSYHGFITDRDGDTLELEADHRRHAEIENAIRDLKYGVGLNHLPSGRFAANAAWLAVQVMAHNLARRAARIGLEEQVATTKTLRRRFFSRWTAHPLGAPPHPASSSALALGIPVQPRPGPAASNSIPSLTGPTGLTIRTIEHPRKLAPTRAASVSRCLVSRQSHPAPPLWAAIGAPHDCQRTPPATFIGTKPEPLRPHAHHSPSCQHDDAASVDLGLAKMYR